MQIVCTCTNFHDTRRPFYLRSMLNFFFQIYALCLCYLCMLYTLCCLLYNNNRFAECSPGEVNRLFHISFRLKILFLFGRVGHPPMLLIHDIRHCNGFTIVRWKKLAKEKKYIDDPSAYLVPPLLVHNKSVTPLTHTPQTHTCIFTICYFYIQEKPYPTLPYPKAIHAFFIRKTFIRK